MHYLPGRGVFEPDRIQRVCFMPDRILVLDSRIRSRHKLRLQRRVLRGEWGFLHGVCVYVYVFAGEFDSC